MLTEILLVFLSALVAFYFYLKYNAGYFKRKGVAVIPGNTFIGNITDLVFSRTDPSDMVNKWYSHPAGKDLPYVGMRVFNNNVILVKDPELVKQVMIKDFNKFSNRSMKADLHNDALAATNLFFTKNPEWRMIRTKLTPVFTSGKIKQMFHLIEEVGQKLSNYISKTDEQNQNMEVKRVCGLFTTDVISSIAFGLDINSFKDPDNEFRTSGHSMFDFTIRRAIDFTAVFFLPKLVPLLGARMVPKEVETFFRRVFTFAVEERKKSGAFRNDLIDILIAFQKDSDKGDTQMEFTDEMLLGQATVFFVAGFETSSSAMAFTLYELAQHPDLQKRLRKEIKDVYKKENGNVTYEAINSMEYLAMVLDETLRLYPPLPFLDREVTLGPNETGYSLEPFGDFVMPPGMPIYIPAAGLHRDSKYFPNPLKYDPERFSLENKGNIVSGTYVPFGLGGRNCIGERIGLLQAKVGLFHFLRNHYVKPNAQTLNPMKLNKRALVIQAEGGIYLDIVKDSLIH